MNKYEDALIWGKPLPTPDLLEVDPPVSYYSPQYKLVRFQQIRVKYTSTYDKFVPSPVNPKQLVWRPF